MFEVDGFDDASSPCKFAIEPTFSSSGLFETNEICKGPKSSSENS
jgi:hypothetical protein